MNETQKAYWAGFVDGEGSIGIMKTKSSHFLRITISQNKKYIVEEAKEEFGFGSVGSSTARERKINGIITSKKTVMWYWNTTTNQAEEVLKLLLPYLRIKKNQALLALQFQKYKRKTTVRGQKKGGGYQSMSKEVLNKRESFKQEISKLNN